MEIGGLVTAHGISLASLSAMERNWFGAKTMENELDLPWDSRATTLFKMALLLETGDIINFYTTKITTYTVFFQ